MDELVIEDKKYISSKRAAKMTGYAKDYVGQLCREGRVAARLVGRSWYVLEAAIQDHRFGPPMSEASVGRDNPVLEKPASVETPSTWESPRYEAISDEVLPSVNRLREAEPVQNLEDSWKAWFNRFEHQDPEPAPTESVGEEDVIEELEPAPTLEEIGAPTESVGEEIEEDLESVPVPIHAYQRPPKEFLPVDVSVVTEAPRKSTIKKRRSGLMIRMTQVTGAVVALVIATLAVLNSGYIDQYIPSSSQASIITGMSLYNK